MEQTLSIIGAGKVGRVLGHQFNTHQIFTIRDVLNRTVASGLEACEFIGAGNAITDYAELQPADVFMIAVPDDQIKACSLRLQKQGLIQSSTIVFHCSGALGSKELQLNRGAASMHPLRSFADPAHVAHHFFTTMCTLEGDEYATQYLSLALKKIGMQVVAINQEGKTLYHAAAVFASNYLVTLMDASLRTFEAAGISPEMALRMAKPLAHESFNNIFRLGPKESLTGPVARGDVQTIKRHQSALKKWDGDMAELYTAMAKSTKNMKDRD